MIDHLKIKLFNWTILASMVYLVYSIIYNLTVNFLVFSFFQDLLGFLFVLVIYLLALRHKHWTNTLIIFFCIYFNFSCFLNWYIWGGLDGPVSYTYIAIILATILLVPMRMVLYIAIPSLIVNAFMVFNQVYDPGVQLGETTLSVSFIIIAATLSLIMSFTKGAYDLDGKSLKRSTRRLNKVNSLLDVQNNELKERREEVFAINENLEKIIQDRTAELTNKNQQLTEMAFVNAHLMRAPLANIQGLINLLEKEDLDEQARKNLKEIKDKAERTDELIRHLNDATY